MDSIVKNISFGDTPSTPVPPGWLVFGLQYEAVVGSQAYGTANEDSDIDVYGFCVPPKEIVFPHLTGYIHGFGAPPARFDQFLATEIPLPSGKTADIQIFSIVRYFQLCMENNPNMIDTLFVPDDCVLHMSEVGKIVRDHRGDFLHKGLYAKFKGYAASQMRKIQTKTAIGKRIALVERYGFDTKYAGHLVRLYLETEQLINEHTMDLCKHSHHLRNVREGRMSLDDIMKFSAEMDKKLDDDFKRCTLPDEPNEARLRDLLKTCLTLAHGG